MLSVTQAGSPHVRDEVLQAGNEIFVRKVVCSYGCAATIINT